MNQMKETFFLRLSRAASWLVSISQFQHVLLCLHLSSFLFGNISWISTLKQDKEKPQTFPWMNIVLVSFLNIYWVGGTLHTFMYIFKINLQGKYPHFTKKKIKKEKLSILQNPNSSLITANTEKHKKVVHPQAHLKSRKDAEPSRAGDGWRRVPRKPLVIEANQLPQIPFKKQKHNTYTKLLH